jgi:glutathione-independent formaldehyde dehydrogenase
MRSALDLCRRRARTCRSRRCRCGTHSWCGRGADRRHEPERLAHAKKVGFEPIDLSAHDRLGELVAEVLGVPEVDCAIDCVGFEAKGQGSDGHVIEAPAVVLNGLMEITRPAGSIGIPGLYVTDDPGAKEKAAQQGMLSLRFGLGWAKSHSLHTGQTPVLKYNRQLMQAILWGRLPIGKIVNVKVISLDQAPKGYRNFDAGVPLKTADTCKLPASLSSAR